jgi:DivIVA domain-containing protein
VTAEELRLAELRETFRGADPGAVEAALDRWADIIERGERLDPAELTGQRFRRRFRGYNRQDVAALINRLTLENI